MYFFSLCILLTVYLVRHVLKAKYKMVKHTQELGIASACEESDLSMKFNTSKVPYIQEPRFLLVLSVFLVSLTVVVKESHFLRNIAYL